LVGTAVGGMGVAVTTFSTVFSTTCGVPATTVTTVWTGGWQAANAMLAITTNPTYDHDFARDILLLQRVSKQMVDSATCKKQHSLLAFTSFRIYLKKLAISSLDKGSVILQA